MWSSAAGAGAHLMGSADEVQVVTVEELADDVGSEREGDAAVVLSPALHVFVRVRPQQVAQEACRREGGRGVRMGMLTPLLGRRGLVKRCGTSPESVPTLRQCAAHYSSNSSNSITKK